MKTVLWGIVFIGIAIGSPFMATAVYVEAAGDWTAIIGSGEYRDPRLPMWLTFGMACFLGAFTAFGAVCNVMLVVRILRERRLR